MKDTSHKGGRGGKEADLGKKSGRRGQSFLATVVFPEHTLAGEGFVVCVTLIPVRYSGILFFFF